MALLKFTQRANGWVVTQIGKDILKWAKQRRLHLQEIYGAYENVHLERKGWTNDAWGVGDVGEFVFDAFLTEKGVSHKWFKGDDEQLGTADFEVLDRQVGVKTWRVDPRFIFGPGYDVSYSHKSVDRQSESQQVFIAWEAQTNNVIIVGAMECSEFLSQARFYKAAEKLSHGGATPNDIWLLSENKLTRIEKWLVKLVGPRWGDEDVRALPYLDSAGELRIPFNCPYKYRWWQGGQSIEQTLAELKGEAKVQL